jgi:hypothetical protein
MEILSESSPKRCEVCHQTDYFDAEMNYCRRCGNSANELNSSKRSILNWLKTLFLSVLVFIYLLSIFPILESFITELKELKRYSLDGVILSSIIIFIASIIVRFKFGYKDLAGGMLFLAGLIMLIKPFAAPIKSVWPASPDNKYETVVYPFSITSETHLYFLLPGLILVCLSVIIYKLSFDNSKKLKKKYQKR